ncbi:DUF2247 family protein [Pseudomonas frederiksbergensis]|uniref:DUF2247 family protein n=1 Tax=Pseudomonas frederiksbergensis TaxID=104087 RepID=UPI00197DD39A|nr:DUF2247 family protein [Pseudomonas frederiksbergensis]MBN3862001.1 DUF2247 family protein [Pseudomonas frederiksbergensis]
MKKLLLDGHQIYKKTPWLNWKELLYGFKHGLIDEKGVSEYACEALTEMSLQEAIELASLLPQEDYLATNLLQSLADKDLSAETDTAKPWIFLLLSFLFEHQENYEDPFEIVEEIYADFDYPEEIAPLVRYMPPPEGVEGSEERLFENWKTALSVYKDFFEQQNRFSQ